MVLRTLGEVPLVWFAGACVAAWFAVRGRARALRRVAGLAGSLCCVLLLLAVIVNVFTAGFLVSFGANVVSIAEAHRNGQSMYHAVAGGQMYSLVYGPYTYLVYELLPRHFDTLTTIKAEQAVIDLAWVATTFYLLRRRVRTSVSLALTGFGAACLLAVPAGILGVRGDMWCLLAITLALRAARLQRWLFAAAAAGICCGFAVDVKPNLGFEALLILILLWHRHKPAAAILAACVAAVVALMPFAFATLSLRNYLAWLQLTSQRATFSALVTGNSLFALLIFSPAALLFVVRGQPRPHPRWLLPGITAMAVAVAILTGAKSGGGIWHLWPLLPFALDWAASEAGRLSPHRGDRLIAAIALASLVVSLRWGLRTLLIERPRLTIIARQTERMRIDELQRLLSSSPETRFEMAPGATMTSSADDLRYVLVAAGRPYEIDMVAAGEALKTNPSLLQPLAATVGNCNIVWVVPHGEIPFSTFNNNETQAAFPELFPRTVRAALLARHAPVERGFAYDVWACPRNATGLPRPMSRMLP